MTRYAHDRALQSDLMPACPNCGSLGEPWQERCEDCGTHFFRYERPQSPQMRPQARRHRGLGVGSKP